MSAKGGPSSRSKEDNNDAINERTDQPIIPATADKNTKDVNMGDADESNKNDPDPNADNDPEPPHRTALPSPTSRFGHFPKYTKPKIGPMYQCAVPKFVPPGAPASSAGAAAANNNEEEESGGEGSAAPGSSSSVSVSGNSAARSGRSGRGRGRGGHVRGRGGRGKGSSIVTTSGKQEVSETLSKGETDAITMANAAAEELQDNYGKRIVPRGGICIHRPLSRFASDPSPTEEGSAGGVAERAAPVLDSQEDFLTFSRNMFLQTPRPCGGIDIDGIWDSDAERMFGARAVASLSSGQEQKKKKSSKRKAAASIDALVDDCESIRSSGEPCSPKKSVGDCEMEGESAVEEVARQPCAKLGDGAASMLPLCGLEDDEHMLSYLQASHRGDYQKAKLSTLVNVDRGYGVHRRKAQRKKQKEECTYSDPTTFTSESWRWRLHQARPTMLGDLRASPNTGYQYFASSCIDSSDLTSTKLPWRYQELDRTGTVEEGKAIAHTRSCSIDWTQDQIEKAKKIWKSILLFTDNVLGKMDDLANLKSSADRNGINALLTDDNRGPLLSDLLVLVTKAHALPTPEETFGRRDPSARVMSQNMNAIIDAIEMGRDCAAQLLLALKDDGDGLELPALQAAVLEMEQKCPVKIQEMDVAKKLIHEASLWEEKLQNNVEFDADSGVSDEEVLLEKKLTLEKVERLVSKGKNLTLRPRSLVRLENRVEQAHVLRRKIIVWNEARNQENPQNIKFISGLIKEANKIDLMFPEVLTLTGVHKKAEEWMDRASIAVRTTISFQELESLVSTGEELPLDVSDLLEKLQVRMKQAQMWMDRVNAVVAEHEDKFVWLKRIRSALNDKNDNAKLVSLVSDGSRIPVDMDCMKLLQIEIDARNWTIKCMPWIPNSSEDSDEKAFRRGKIDDVRDHLDKASSLRDRLWFGSDEEKSGWILKGERQLSEIVEMAESWFDKYDVYISQDNRSKKSRMSMPLSKLQAIVEEANTIPLNLGNPSTKMSRILSQAEEWMEKYHSLLKRCGIESSYTPTRVTANSESSDPVKIDLLHEAVSEADSELSIDLEEVIKLKEVVQVAQAWIDKSTLFSLKKNSSAGKKKRGANSTDEKHSMEEISELINEASAVPIDISDELNALKIEQSKVMSWRIQMQRVIKEITSSFDSFSQERTALYSGNSDSTPTLPASMSDELKPPDLASNTRQNVTRQQSKSRSNSVATDDTGASGTATPVSVDVPESNSFPLVTNFLRTVKTMNVLTPESYVADELGGVMSWLAKAFKFLSSHSEAFDRKNASALDKLIKSGQSLLRFKSYVKEIPEDPILLDNLRERWVSVLNEDLDKLLDLKDKRSKFFEWCEKADGIISDADTKLPIETLQKLDDESASFPSTSEVVNRVRQRTKDTLAWLRSTQDMMKPGSKISMEDAKKIIDEGEKLNIMCQELKTLKSALRTTKTWVTRVKKCGAENGETAVANVNELIHEHNSFLVTAMEEVDKLKQATCGYCICRLPYEGFMIGCDGCEEWYHGPCVGVTEEQASKFDKYVCLRCSALRIYKENATTVAGILRKWSSSKCLSKARLLDSQRYNRKVRTCEKDLAKAKENLQKWEQSLPATASDPSNVNTAGDTGPTAPLTKGEPPSSREISTDHASAGDKEVAKTKNEKGLEDKIEKARTTIENCEKRMEGYKIELTERTKLEALENSVALNLKTWCKMVKREVLSPMTKEEAELSRPRSDCHTSDPIENAKTLAGTLGIVDIPDVGVVLNSFKVFSWCLHLLEVLMRKPTVEEIRALLVLCDSNSFKFPESKCVRMLRSVSSRAQIWQSKVKKALTADNKTSKPYDTGLLRELLLSAKQIPLAMPEEARLWSTIEDNGCRHCICGGPSDGSFMVGCDNCDKWFHGSCMKIDKAASDSLTKWICPPCSGKETPVHEANSPVNDKPPVMELSPLMQHISPHAPNPVLLWPPFGLRSSTHAVEALGKVGESDNEDFVMNETAVHRKDSPASKLSLPQSSKDGPKYQNVAVSDAGSKAVPHEGQINPTSSKSSPKIVLNIPAQSPAQSGPKSTAGQGQTAVHLAPFPSKATVLSCAPRAVIKTPMQIRAEFNAAAQKCGATLSTSPLKNATASPPKSVPKTATQSISQKSTVRPSPATKTTVSSSPAKAAHKPAPQSKSPVITRTVKNAVPLNPAHLKNATVGGAPKVAVQTNLMRITGTTRAAPPLNLASSMSGTISNPPKIAPKPTTQSENVLKTALKITPVLASPGTSKLLSSVSLGPTSRAAPKAAELGAQSTSSKMQNGAPVAHSSLQTMPVSSSAQFVFKPVSRPNSGIRYPRSENTTNFKSATTGVLSANAPPSIISNHIHNSAQVTAVVPTAMETDQPSASETALEEDTSSPLETSIPVSTSCISNGSKNHATNNVEVNSASP